jgi:hypothetical protein
MKKYLFILLFLAPAITRAQGVTLYDLINLSNLTNTQAHDFFYTGKVFKLSYEQDVNGLSVDHYQDKTEEVIIGNAVKTSNGLLHTVNYTTTKVNYILKMIGQAKGAGLNVSFEGADASKNIYFFYSFLYIVHIYINVDNSVGTVQVQQKDFTTYD